MRRLLLILCFMLVPSMASAQTAVSEDHAEIRQLIQSFDAAIEAKDLPTMTALFYDGQIVWRGTMPPEGREAVSRMSGTPQAVVEQTGAHLFLDDPRFTDFQLKERFGPPTIDTDGQMGSVSFNYAFFFNEQVQNWGRESWQLVRTNDGWRILALLFSANLVQVAPMPANHLAPATVVH